MPRSDYHRDEYSPPPRRRGGTQVAEYEEIDIRERRRGNAEPDFMREDHGRGSHAGALVVKEDIEETRSRGPARSRHGGEREYIDEEVIVARSGNRDRDRGHGRHRGEREVVEEEEIRYHKEGRERGHDKHRGGREVVEEEEVIVAKSGGRERGHDRHRGGKEVVEEEEIRYHREGREKPRRRERETIEEEIVYKPRKDPHPYGREQVTEEWIYKEREPSPPMVAREVEEWSFAPRKREPSVEREQITIRERERDRQPPPPREYRDESITIRERERERPRGDYHEEEITIREKERERAPPLRSEYREDITIREREREGPRDWHDEQITIRERERERAPAPPPPREDRYEEIRIRERERERPRGDFREEEIRIRETSHERQRRDFRDESISIHEDTRSRGGLREEEINIRERDTRSRRGSNSSGVTTRTRGFKGGEYKEQELVIRRDDHGPHGRNDEIVIRRNERSPSVSSATRIPSPQAPPEPIRAPPIHQEIITHHRHIDHGFAPYQAPYSAPAPRSRHPSPPAPPSPPRSAYDEIEIHRKGKANGQRYDDDIIINRRRSSPARTHREPSPARSTVSRRAPLPAPQDESDFYARKTSERAYIGEAHNGATQDWAIVDVPPGTNRVKMDGVGGASEEVTWQRYNGVRRSRFIPDQEREHAPEPQMDRRKYVGMRPKTDNMWTEITKDLVIKDALDGAGYDYEETEFFFYVMEYLRYEDVSRLVAISDDLRHKRRDRIRQIEWEQKHNHEPRSPARMLADKPWEEEREKIVEREWYDRRGPPRMERPPMPPPKPRTPQPPPRPDLSLPRVVEKEKVVVIRGS